MPRRTDHEILAIFHLPFSTLTIQSFINIFHPYRISIYHQNSKLAEISMASTSAVSMAMPLIRASQNTQPSTTAFFKPLPVRQSRTVTVPKSAGKFEVRASLKEKAVTGLTAAALTASLIVPDVAEAASGVSPSLKNFLLSIGAGGVVLTAIIGAIVGVSNFDPVKRG